MNIRDKLMRKARKPKVNADREEYKLKRSEVNIMIRKAKSDNTRTLLSENSRNSGRFLGSNKMCISFEGEKHKIREIVCHQPG